MSTLIVALPRTGSTELGKRLSLQHKLEYIFEPFNPPSNNININHLTKSVVKTIIFQKPDFVDERFRLNWLLDLISKFDNVILLSRKDLMACADSWAYLCYKSKKSNFSSVSSYLWELTPNHQIAVDNIQIWNNELKYISDKVNIPITYYEDIYDLNDKDKLRKGDRNNYENKLI